MKLDRHNLRNVMRVVIKESFENDPRTKALRARLDKRNENANKIKEQLKSFDRDFIIQAYQICEAMPDLDFAKIVREMVDEMIENNYITDNIHQTVSDMLQILHADKSKTFYIESENVENDVQMEFAFKTVTDIMENLKDYYVNYFVEIGKGL